MAKTNNMEIWQSVETTDPTYTKKVNQRGGFTAIGAQYQLMRATETFGPMGKGWGVKGEHIQKWEDVGLAVYEATLWYVVKDKEYYIPIHSSIKYHTSGRVDDDFYKKVATDALTKALSKLGFSADVFMGKFDDNKYVNQLKKTHKQPDVDYKYLISKAADGLNEEDKKTVMSNIDKVNSTNARAILNRIKEMESSYKDKS